MARRLAAEMWEAYGRPTVSGDTERMGRVDFPMVAGEAEAAFRHDPDVLAKVHCENFSGRRALLSTAFCPKSPRNGPVFRIVFRSADGADVPLEVGTCGSRSVPTVLTTLNRLLYIQFVLQGGGEGSARLAAARDDLVARLRRADPGLPDLLHMTGSPLFFRETEGEDGARVFVVDGIELIRKGMLAAVVHASGVPTKKTRQAVTSRGGRSSLISAALALIKSSAVRGEGLLELVHCMDCAWERLFAALAPRFGVHLGKAYGDRPPDAFQVLCLAYVLDKEPRKTPEMKQALAFLGMTFMCGFRSGQVASMRCLGYRPETSAPDIYVFAEPDGRPNANGGSVSVVVRFSKNCVSTHRVIPLPAWLSGWVRDWDAARTPAGNHSGLFQTPTGMSLSRHVDGVHDGKKKSRMESLMASVLKVCRDLGVQGVLGDRVNFTRYFRSVFFNSLTHTEPGCMMDLIGRAEKHVVLQAPHPSSFRCSRLSATLPPEEASAPSDPMQIIRWMAGLNDSSEGQACRSYNENVLNGIAAIIPRYDAIKTYVWALLDRQAAEGRGANAVDTPPDLMAE